MNLREIGNTKYMALESFKNNGEGVITPVWVTANGDKVHAWTERNSWKVKRIRRNGRVRVAQSDARGNPEGEWVEAQARILDTAEEEADMRRQLTEKYGFVFRAMYFMGKLRNRDTKRVVVEISPSQ